MRIYEVTIDTLVRQKVEVAARNEDEAEDKALNSYQIKDSHALSEVVTEIEDVTDYRKNAYI